jgi:5'-nucleotidase
MRLLLTNDDGIHAPGLKTLEAIAAELSDDVIVVAPETDQSGVAHSLSLSNPLRLREIGPKHYAVQGTPTDCVIMGVRHIMREHRPDLILSGVNRGQNVAEDVTYSGTIAAGIEAALLGIPAIALSQAFWGPDGDKSLYWDCAKRHGPGLIRQILKSGIAPGTLINVNFPPCPPDQVKGVAIATQGRRDADLMRIEERRDGRGNPYFWLMFQKGDFTPGEGTDLAALAAHKIAVTPLRPDLTDGAELLRYAAAFA